MCLLYLDLIFDVEPASNFCLFSMIQFTKSCAVSFMYQQNMLRSEPAEQLFEFISPVSISNAGKCLLSGYF